jgi:hypothetical protein
VDVGASNARPKPTEQNSSNPSFSRADSFKKILPEEMVRGPSFRAGGSDRNLGSGIGESVSARQLKPCSSDASDVQVRVSLQSWIHE